MHVFWCGRGLASRGLPEGRWAAQPCLSPHRAEDCGDTSPGIICVGQGGKANTCLLSHSSCSVAGCVRSSVMKSMIMQSIFLDEASCLHIESYTYKYCEFRHGFISLASNSTITANLLDIQSSQNILPGARCLAKNIPKEFQELLFSVTTFADVCSHPPSCRQLNVRTLPCQKNDGNRCKSWTTPELLSLAQDGTAVPKGVHRELGCEEVVKCRCVSCTCHHFMADLVDVGERKECRTDSAAARTPSRALGVCPCYPCLSWVGQSH